MSYLEKAKKAVLTIANQQIAKLERQGGWGEPKGGKTAGGKGDGNGANKGANKGAWRGLPRTPRLLRTVSRRTATASQQRH